MLGRPFLTLYLIIVLVILGAGWGLDRLYLTLAGPETPDPMNRAFFSLLEANTTSANGLEAEQLQSQLDGLPLSGQVLRLSDFASSDFKHDLQAGEPLVLTAKQQRQVYYQLPDSELVVRLLLPLEATERGLWYRLLLLLFYLLLALVIYLWIGPLVRDLRSLQTQARLVGRADPAARVRLNPRSAVYNLSLEFNRMQQRIDELLGSYREMTYAVSHELRTPLARMKFALELAGDQASPEQRRRQMDNLRTDITQMNELINQLLNYAGFETQSQQLNQQEGAAGALCALIEGLIDSLTRRATDAAARLPSFTVTDQMPQQRVFCEWNLLQRVMQNLLHNGAKYANRHVWVSLSYDAGFYQVSVEDDGPGIAETERRRVFDSFVRLHQEPTLDRQGFGLGLAIVKRIMDWHGGTVTVTRSQALQGACFTVRWPKPAVLANKNRAPQQA